MPVYVPKAARSRLRAWDRTPNWWLGRRPPHAEPNGSGERIPRAAASTCVREAPTQVTPATLWIPRHDPEVGVFADGACATKEGPGPAFDIYIGCRSTRTIGPRRDQSHDGASLAPVGRRFPWAWRPNGFEKRPLRQARTYPLQHTHTHTSHTHKHTPMVRWILFESGLLGAYF